MCYFTGGLYMQNYIMKKDYFKITKSNIKLGNTKKVGTINKLAGCCLYHFNIKNPRWDVDKLLNENGCSGSCGGFCAGCFNIKNWKKSPCYVIKTYLRYPTVLLSHGRNTLLMRLQPEQCFIDLDKQLTNAKKKYEIIRIHQSGEIETQKEIDNYVLLAEKHPETIFYIYTKNYNAIYNVVSQKELPDNMFILLSIWHQSGINEFKKMRQYKNIKAFIYCDDYNYAADGLQPEFMCPAYDVNGKMDHRFTCDKCMACCSKHHQIIGCNEH